MQYILLMVIGLAAGTLGAMLGLGGSIVLIPALNEVFGPRQHLHQACAMILNLVVVTAATWGHHKAGVVSAQIVKITIPAAVVAVVVGVQISELEVFKGGRERYLTGLFGVFLFCAAAFNAGKLFTRSDLRRNGSVAVGNRSPWKSALLVGAPTGLISGLLGVGGGIVAVPAQQLFLGIPLRSAIGNSAATICGLSVVGALAKNYNWWAQHEEFRFEPLLISALIVPAAVAGGLIGSRLTHRLPYKWVAGVLVLVLIVAGLRQVSHALS